MFYKLCRKVECEEESKDVPIQDSGFRIGNKSINESEMSAF